MARLLKGCFRLLASRVVPGSSFPRHADPESVVFKHLRAIAAGVLHASIEVSHHARRRLPPRQRPTQRLERQRDFQTVFLRSEPKGPIRLTRLPLHAPEYPSAVDDATRQIRPSRGAGLVLSSERLIWIAFFRN
jgi:hypothetical protein